MNLEITGKASGDGSSFCFDVADDEYRRLMGDARWAEEVQENKEFAEQFQLSAEPLRIYPDQIIELLGLKSGQTVKLEIRVLE